MDTKRKRRSLREQASIFDQAYADGDFDRATSQHRAIINDVSIYHERGVETILDIGCGRGLLLKEFEFHRFHATGTEIATTLAGSDLRRLPVFHYSIDDLHQFKDESYDMVILCDTLRFLRDDEEAEKALREAWRIARIGAVATTEGDYHRLAELHDMDPRIRVAWNTFSEFRVARSKGCKMHQHWKSLGGS